MSAAETPIEIPGKWFGHQSLQPFHQALAWSDKPADYIFGLMKKYGGSPVFKMHPGTKLIALTDYCSGSFLLEAPPDLLDRPPGRNFGMGKMRPYTFGDTRPTLLDNGESHFRSREFITKMMNHYSEDLAPAIRATAEKIKAFWHDKPTIPPLALIGPASVISVYHALLGVSPNVQTILDWTEHMQTLNFDTTYARLTARNAFPKPSQAAISTQKELYDLVRSSERWPFWCDLAKRYQIEEQELVENTVFTISFNSGAIYSLYPTLVEISLSSELFEAVKKIDIQSSFALDEIDNIPLIENIMIEGTRLYTRPNSIVKRAQQDFVLPAKGGRKFQVRAGEDLYALVQFMHRDSDVFTNPEKFFPDRYEDNPQLAKRVYGYVIPQKGQNQYGCAAFHNRFGPKLWKALLLFFLRDCRWSWSEPPSATLNRFRNVEPPDVKLTNFEVTNQKVI